MTRNREQFEDESPDRWIDRQLRRIPLPAGLLRRLRRIAETDETLADESLSDGSSPGGSWSSAALDAALRNVPLPHGLRTRLKRIVREETSQFRDEKRGLRILDDEKLDAAICDVAIPTGLTDRLAEIALSDADPVVTDSVGADPVSADPVDTKTSDQLTGQLREIAMPSGMLDRLSQIPAEASSTGDSSKGDPSNSKRRNSVTTRRRPNRSPVTWQWAGGMALSIALLISLVYYGSEHLRPKHPDKPQDGASSLIASATDNVDPDSNPDEAAHDATEEYIDIAINEIPFPYDLTSGIFWEPRWPGPIIRPESPDRPENDRTNPNDYLASDPAQSRPVLHVVSDLEWRGVRPPWVDAEALSAQIHTGIHPFVSPGKHDEFRVRQLPLHTGRDSYDWTAAALPRKRLDRVQLKRWRAHLASRVRTEDFINAIDYQYAPPRDQALALRTYGSTSPFGKGNVQLLQIGVQAASSQDESHLPVHLVVLVDTSPSMARNNHLVQVQRALDRLLESLESHDRVSIVTTSYQPQGAGALIENVGKDQLSQLHEVVASLRATPIQDVSAAVRVSSNIARKTPAGANGRRTFVWLTDGADGNGEASDSWQEDVQRSLREFAAKEGPLKDGDSEAGQKVDLQVINVGDGEENGGQLAHLLGDTLDGNDGETRKSQVTASDTESIYWALRQTLAGASLAVAHDVEVEITFDPKTVIAYRLLGHEATTIVGPESDSRQITMHVSQAATVLFEIKLNSTGSDSVATAKLTWRDATTDQKEEQTQRISRWQFVPSFEESAIPLQAATIAAATAESLRQSVYVFPANLSIGAVRRLAWSVHPKVAKNRSFEQLIRLLSQAEEAGL